MVRVRVSLPRPVKIIMRICSSCLIEKELSEFNRNNYSPDGRQSKCRDCVSIRFKAYYDIKLKKPPKAVEILPDGMKRCGRCVEVQELSNYNKDGSRPDGLAYRCKICAREAYRNFYYSRHEENKENDRNRLRRRNRMVNYGCQQRDYENLLRLQSGCCAICKTNTEKLVVDHCHICGFGKLEAVRGLLCSKCNSHGNFSLENPHILEKAKNYTLVHYNKYHLCVV